MKSYDKCREMARNATWSLNERYGKILSELVENELEDEEVRYLFFKKESISIPKEKFDVLLEKIKNPEVRKYVFEIWIKVAENGYGWSVEVEEKEVIFGKRKNN